MKTSYEIASTEFKGHRPVIVGRFATLDDASEYIQERWQGRDYIDNIWRFYANGVFYRLIGFSLDDIGKFIEEPGKKNWSCYLFNPIKPSDEREREVSKADFPPYGNMLLAVRECYSPHSEEDIERLERQFERSKPREPKKMSSEELRAKLLKARRKPRKDPNAKPTCDRCGSDNLDYRAIVNDNDFADSGSYRCRQCGHAVAWIS